MKQNSAKNEKRLTGIRKEMAGLHIPVREDRREDDKAHPFRFGAVREEDDRGWQGIHRLKRGVRAHPHGALA